MAWKLKAGMSTWPYGAGSKLTGERAYKADTGVLFDELANDEVSRG
jgi:hypothetical protein